ncbi:MAG: hypothetical protein U0167_00475 [bacterium]
MSRVAVRARVLLLLGLVAALSWTTRELNHERVPVPERRTWVTSDNDTMYQLRRVNRAFTEGLAESDPYLNYPEGSPIPWPPYYTALAWAWAAPGAPADAEARHDWVERRVASLPHVLGVATSLVVAAGGIALAGPWAGLVAGTSHALSAASIATSRSGNGDHHALIALLAAAALVLTGRAFRPSALADARGSARRGAVVGALCGFALGVWAASVLFIVPIQVALGWLIIRHAQRRLPGLPAFGAALHATALLVLLPAVLVSPWKAEHPWMVVNLAWTHPLWLALGGLVFVPLLRGKRRSLLRFYPALVLVALVLLTLVLASLPVGPVAGIREGVAWLRRDDVFMSVVGESKGLIGPSGFRPIAVLGAGIFVLPLAWAASAWLALRRDRFELLPWAISLPFFAMQSARQARFSDLLAIPMAVVIAWAIVAAWESPPLAALRERAAALGPARAPSAAALLLGATFLAHAGIVRTTWAARLRDPSAPGVPQPPADVVAMELARWIRAHTPAPPDYAVLAPWTWGHVIEWVAERPTIATNFGTFVGEESFRDSARFLVAEDPKAGEEILARRRVRYLLVTSWLPDQSGHLLRAADPSAPTRFLEVDPGGRPIIQPAWFRTLGARLLFDGGTLRGDGSIGEPLDFLRLVCASAESDPRYAMRRTPTPMGVVWERVPGAIVEAFGAPGDTLSLAVAVRYAAARHELTWIRTAVAGPDGLARLRVPYATEAPNGDGVADGPAAWRLGKTAGQLRIPEAAVLSGGVLRVPAG